MDADVIQYVFLQTLNAAQPYRMSVDHSGELWEDVRYRLERKHGLHEINAKKKGSDSYFVGWLWDSHKTIRDYHKTQYLRGHEDLCKPGCKVVLARKPLAPGMQPFVPQRYRSSFFSSASTADSSPTAATTTTPPTSVRFDASMTDEEKMLALIRHTEQQHPQPQQHHQFRHARQEHHASEPQRDRRPLPPGYICYRCNQPGHWKHNCPTLRDPHFEPFSVPRPPSGIPRSFLKQVTTEEEKRHSMKTWDGRFVAMQAQTHVFDRAHAYTLDDLQREKQQEEEQQQQQQHQEEETIL